MGLPFVLKKAVTLRDDSVFDRQQCHLVKEAVKFSLNLGNFAQNRWVVTNTPRLETQVNPERVVTQGWRASPDLLGELQLHLDLTARIHKEHHNFICTFKA